MIVIILRVAHLADLILSSSSSSLDIIKGTAYAGGYCRLLYKLSR
jgi:hypothetical protein